MRICTCWCLFSYRAWCSPKPTLWPRVPPSRPCPTSGGWPGRRRRAASWWWPGPSTSSAWCASNIGLRRKTGKRFMEVLVSLSSQRSNSQTSWSGTINIWLNQDSLLNWIEYLIEWMCLLYVSPWIMIWDWMNSYSSKDWPSKSYKTKKKNETESILCAILYFNHWHRFIHCL